MKFTNKVLISEDQVGAIGWLVDFLSFRGYEVEMATNEKEARAKLAMVQRHEVEYAMAILDVMLPTMAIDEVENLSAELFNSSLSTGIRLCRYVREELGLTSSELPLICLSARQDDEVERELKALGVPLFKRADEDIRDYLTKRLRKLT